MRDHEFLLAKLLAKNAKAIGRSFLDSVIGNNLGPFSSALDKPEGQEQGGGTEGGQG